VVENLVTLDLDAMGGESDGAEWGEFGGDADGVEWGEISGNVGGACDPGFAGGVATGVESKINVSAQPGDVAVGATLGVGMVGAHASFVDGPRKPALGRSARRATLWVVD
jgi:hypothetical protein